VSERHNDKRAKTLWDLTRGQRLRYASAIGAMGLGILITFGVPLVFRTVLDEVLPSHGANRTWLHAVIEWIGITPSVASLLWTALSVTVVLTAIGGAFHYLRGRWAATAAEAIVRRIRDHLYGHLERLPCRFHDRADTGDVVQRCTSDVETLRVFLAAQVVEIGRAVLMLATVIPILVVLDPVMALIAVALFPVIIAFALGFFRRVRALFRLTDEAEAEMTTVLQENLTGIRVVRAFARQGFERGKFAEKNAEFRNRSERLVHAIGRYWALSDFLCLTQIGIVLLAGGWFLTQGVIGVGTLFAFFTYETMVIFPLRHLGRVLSETGKATVALSRLREILDEPEEDLGDADTDAIVPQLRGAIEVRNLTFAYGSDPVLHDIGFSVAPGETLALIGPPGAGKSTIIQLMLALYPYEHGSIRFDGRELRSLPARHVRAQIGVVLQEPFLYSRTLRENLLVGTRDAEQAAIEAAAEAACIHDGILEFEHGYDTQVGERGITLSGGQRQRVALARALVDEPPILVLDDALSAVDTHTETAILEALERRRGRHTTILIAHRLSTIAHADRILVLDGGRIVESGTHEQLIAGEGTYHRLWRIQGALDEELARDAQTMKVK